MTRLFVGQPRIHRVCQKEFMTKHRMFGSTNLCQPTKFGIFQLCHSSLVIPVLFLAIPGLSLAILGLSLFVPSQFQDVPNSPCLSFFQQYIKGYNKLSLLETMIWYIFQKNISPKRTSCLCVNNVRKGIY